MQREGHHHSGSTGSVTSIVAERVRQGHYRASAREHAFRNERGSKCYRACFAERLAGASATEHAFGALNELICYKGIEHKHNNFV